MRQRVGRTTTFAAASIAAVFVLALAGHPAVGDVGTPPSAVPASPAGPASTTPATSAPPAATASPATSPGPAMLPSPVTSGSPQPTEPPPIPPTAAPQTPSIVATPLRDPDLIPTLVRPFATPSPAPSGAPPTLVPQASATPPTPPPGFGRITADRVFGKANGDLEADGHVLILAGDSTITAESAHYDAVTRLVRAIGNVHYVNANGDTATAKALEYDVARDRVIMDDVEGQTSSITYQAERIHGYLFYKGQRITIDHNGHAILERGWVTTCDLRHVAYHVTGKEIEIRPNDRLVAHGPALYLGKVLVAGLGILSIPLTQETTRRPSTVAPRIGYNSLYGFFLKNYINYYSSPYFYGTVHVDFYQKAGIGLGADIYFARRDGAGSGEFTFYNLHSNAYQQAITGQKNSFQSTLTYQRLFSHHVTLSANANFTTQTLVTAIPPTLSANISVVHNGARSTTSYGGTATTTGPSSSFGGVINHNIAFSPVFSENVSVQLQFAQSVADPGFPDQTTTYSRSVLFLSDTRFSARTFDTDLNISTNHGQTSSSQFGMTTTNPVIGLQRVPELTLRSHPFSVGNLRVPVQFTFVDGIYDDGYDNITTARYELAGQFGSALYRIGENNSISALVGIRQDLYGTGDERGAISENFSLQDFFGRHADNTLAYQEQSVRGFTPMRSFDFLSGFDQINDTFNFYNGSAYRFTAATNYDFRNKFIGSINYQLAVSPSPYSSVLLGDSYDPHGTGYGPLNITLAAPIGRNDYLQFLGDFDFKTHAMEGQNYFLTHNVNDCYQVRLAYREPLHELDLSVSLLAFPSQAVNFGLTGGSILPQSFGSP